MRRSRARETSWSGPLAEVLYYAIPFFVLLLIAEYASFRHLDHDDDLAGYDLRDTGTSLAMGIGNGVPMAEIRALAKLTASRLAAARL